MTKVLPPTDERSIELMTTNMKQNRPCLEEPNVDKILAEVVGALALRYPRETLISIQRHCMQYLAGYSVCISGMVVVAAHGFELA